MWRSRPPVWSPPGRATPRPTRRGGDAPDSDLGPLDLDVDGALLDEPGTAAELSARLGVDVRRLGVVLRRLVGLELVSRSPGRPARFGGLTPEVAFGGLLVRKELEESRRLRSELQQRHRRSVRGTDPAELLEVVRGEETIARRAGQLMRSARHEVRFVDKPPYAEPPTVLHPVERELPVRGVRFRGSTTAPRWSCTGWRTWNRGRRWSQAPVVAEAPLKTTLVDGRGRAHPAGLGGGRAAHRAGGATVPLLDAPAALFGSLWLQALPLFLHNHPCLSTQDARMPTLLTTGMPDRGIAKQFGLSYRTFRRRHPVTGCAAARPVGDTAGRALTARSRESRRTPTPPR